MRKFYFSLILVFSLLLMQSSFACANIETRGLNAENYPDLPLNDFAAGKLGVLSPVYGRSYLIVAYRYLSKHPLSLAEQKSVVAGWTQYFNDYYSFSNYLADAAQFSKTPTDTTSAILNIFEKNQNNYKDYLAWRSACAAALKQPLIPITLPDKIKNGNIVDAHYEINHLFSQAAAKDSLDFVISPLDSGLNYLKFATQRLQAIVADLQRLKIPAEQQQNILTNWIAAQQQLFQINQDGGVLARKLIDKIPTSSSLLLTADCDYMRAASYFYSNQATDVEYSSKLFGQLASNKNYPWQEWMRYLEYRAFAVAANRQAYKNSWSPIVYTTTNVQQLQTALQGMQKLSVDAKENTVKLAAADYCNIINARLDKGFINTLIVSMQSKITTNSIRNFIYLNNITGGVSNENTKSYPLATHSDLINWLNAYILTDPKYSVNNFNIAYHNFEQQPENRAWLLVALNNIQVASAQQREKILAMAGNISVNEPGFFAISAALIKALGKTNKTRDLINEAIAELPQGSNFSTTIHFLTAYIPYVLDVNDLLQHGFFKPSPQFVAWYPTQNTNFAPVYANPAITPIFNHLPLSLLVSITDSKILPDNYRPVLLANIWARAMLLGNPQLARSVEAELIKYNPELQKNIKALENAKTIDEKNTQLLILFLHFPRLNPTVDLSLSDTWDPNQQQLNLDDGLVLAVKPVTIKSFDTNPFWCRGLNSDVSIPTSTSLAMNFFTPMQRQEYNQEQAEIAKIPDGAEWLANLAARLANAHPTDQRYAELLGLAIESTHFAECYDRKSNASKRAFIALKKLYPHSGWSQKTKYYY